MLGGNRSPGDAIAAAIKREREVQQAFRPLQRATQELLADYTAGELQLITGFLSHLEAALADMAAGQSEPG